MEDKLIEAKEYMQQGNFEKAANAYLEVLKENPQNLIAQGNLGMAYLKLQQLPLAIRHLTLAISLSPEQAQLYSERAVAYFLSQRVNDAMEDFNMAQKLEPENPYRYSSRAFVRDKAGDTQGAIADYQKAIELDPEDAVAYNNLGLIQEKIGYKEQAKNNFSKADSLEGIPSPQREAVKKWEGAEPIAKEEKQRISFNHFGKVLKSVLTTREGFNDFVGFLFRNKK